MGLKDFLFGKITYKEHSNFAEAENEELVELPLIGGTAYIHFDEEGARGIRFELPNGEYELSVIIDRKERSLTHFKSTGDKSISLSLSITLLQRAELVVKNQNCVDARIPLW